MRVDAGITGRAGQLLLVPVRNVLSSDGVPKPLAQAHINHMQDVGIWRETHEEIVRFDVAMKMVVLVLKLDAVQLCVHMKV